MLSKERIIRDYNISEDLIENSEISWQDYCEIYEDFIRNKYEEYKHILEEFLDTYLKDVNEKYRHDQDKKVKIHSIRSRVKDAEHLIVKIIRKKQENQLKYRNLNKDNYDKFITDLIGIRCIVLFKEDWENIHHFLISQFENDEKYYVKDSIADFDENESHFYMAEKPKVHIRNGDNREFYDRIIPPDSVVDDKTYRSVHYIIKYKGVYIEIQVRTIFEEGWGEVDHEIVYPYYEDDKILKEYTGLLNRLCGLADEMSSFFYRLKSIEIPNTDCKPQEDKGLKAKKVNKKSKEASADDKREIDEVKLCNTPIDCLQAVLNE